MSKIKAVNTTPEIAVRKYLFKRGYRFRLHKRNLPGTPDIVLQKYRTVIFINGCFWHGHEYCKKASLPKSRIEFWHNKIEKNKERDAKNYLQLIKLGWKVITIFQCETTSKNIENTMSSVLNELTESLKSLHQSEVN